MTKDKKLVVWIIVFGPIIALLLLSWLASEFIERNWFIPFLLSMIPFIVFLKLGGYKGISTVVAIVVTSFTLTVSWWLFPKGEISDAIIFSLWIVVPIVVWWDRQQLPR